MKEIFHWLKRSAMQIAIVAPVDETLPWRLSSLRPKERHQVESVEVNLVGLVADRVSLLHLLDQVGLSAAAAKVGMKSCSEQMSLMTRPGSMTPGQRMTQGTLQPPSQFVSFSPRNGVAPPSGHDMTSAPLSVVKTTMVLSAMPEIVELLEQLADVAVELDHAVRIETESCLADARTASDA